MEKMRNLIKKPLWLLSILVVFVTVYSLVLPAITLDEETANDAPDIVLDSNTEETTVQNDETTEKQSEEIPEETVETATVEETETVTAETEVTVETINNEGTQEPQETEPVQVEEESEYPAVKFSQVVNDSIIYVEAPEGAFKKGTTMEAEEVEDTSELEESINNDLRNSVVKKIKAIDIRFIYNEEEVEPLVPIKVSITSAFVENNDENALLMHIDDEGKTNEVKQNEVKEEELETLSEEIKDVVEEHEEITEVSSDNTITFESDSFSVYAIVYVQTIQIEADGGTYNITVSYTEDAKIPEGSVLNVREIEAGTVEYELYLTKSAAQLNTTNENISFARFFDIEILKDGEKIEPTVPVEVKIKYTSSLRIEDVQTLKIVHFVDEDNTEIINDISIDDDSTLIAYEQDSFSVTGVIVSHNVTPITAYDDNYAIIVKYNGDYYATLSDGSLQKAKYDETNNIASVDMQLPLMWTYRTAQGDDHPFWEPYVLRIAEEALTFDGNNLPTSYSYRYIDPNANSGITSEEVYKDDDGTRRADSKAWACQLRYDYSTHSIYGTILNHWVDDESHDHYDYLNNGKYIGVVEELGKLKITGNNSSTNAAEIYLAEPRGSISAYGTSNAVNHIDISVKGSVNLDLPLAYGTYYDENGNEIVINAQHPYTQKVEGLSIPIKQEDMMRAEITAYKVVNGTNVPLDNMFYITGYSDNGAPEGAADQVRIEGFFKVAYTDVAGVNRDATSRAARLASQVYYTVSTPKKVTVELEYKDSSGIHKLYDKKPSEGGQKIEVSTLVTLSASFSYWDPKNECPGAMWNIDSQNVGDDHGTVWSLGDIPDGFANDNEHVSGSGMDFKLGDKGDGSTIAVEIVKTVVDEEGNTIHVGSEPKYSFDIYYNLYKNANYAANHSGKEDASVLNTLDLNSYIKLHNKSITIGTNGTGSLYDYDVAKLLNSTQKYSMIYIKENQIAENIVDTEGFRWTYTGNTISKTEYVQRFSERKDDHEVESTTSFPEVIGKFTLPESSTEKDSNFLEFYVYNEYKRKTYPVCLLKIDESKTSQYLEGAEFELYGPYTTSQTNPDKNGKLINADYQIITGSDGKALISSSLQDNSYYYLYEIKSPAGYNLLSSPIEISVDSRREDNQAKDAIRFKQGASDNGGSLITITIDGKEVEGYQIIVTNTPGVELPMTGGLGTEYICTIGGLMILVSGIIIIRRRYMA